MTRRLFLLTALLALLLGAAGPSPVPPARASAGPLPFVPADTDPSCGYSSPIDSLLAQSTQDDWLGWIKKLSGVEPVSVGGNPITITTRKSPDLFNGSSLAYDFVRETVSTWYPGQVQDHLYTYGGATWKNLVLTIPGTKYPDIIVILSAHLDDASDTAVAPGADDNGTGSATLLEAARILQGHPLPATLRIIWFTGEEQGLRGSGAYTSTQSLDGVIGDINLDMFGFDGNGDRCVELHVGTLPASNRVGSCFVQAIQAYQPDLSYGFLTTGATGASDHASFWAKQVGAIEVLENYPYNSLDPNGCPGGTDDWSPYYHQHTDTIDHLTLPYTYNVARAALAAAFSLASQEYNHIFFPYIFNW
jgi:hypothetical protein